MGNDSSDVGWQEKRALIIGRAYPEPSKRHIETVCTGAITEDGELLRLYPISWRYLNENQQYRLWSWAKFEVRKNPTDKRKESYKVREESISVISHVDSPSERLSLLKKAFAPDKESLEVAYKADWTSVGIVEISLSGLAADKPKVDWGKTKTFMRQTRIDVEVKPLDQSPIEFTIDYKCKNNPTCKGHTSRLIGWEYVEAFRKFRITYGSDLEAIEQIKTGLVERFADPRKSAFALLGTHSRYPVWMIGQLYFFDKATPPTLF